MRLNFALICSFLSASVVLAGVVRKNDDHPQRAADGTTYDYNRVMSGAFSVYNDTANFVTGTFSVPSANASSPDETVAYFLVGMGGLTDGTAIFGGINLVMLDQQLSYEAFSWLAPDLPEVFNLEVNPRDNIKISVNATSPDFVIVKIENLTTNQSQSIDLYIPSAHRQIAGCFVADRALLEPASSVDLADFGAVTFTDVKLTASTATVNGLGIAVIQVEQKNLTSVSVNGDSITITQL